MELHGRQWVRPGKRFIWIGAIYGAAISSLGLVLQFALHFNMTYLIWMLFNVLLLAPFGALFGLAGGLAWWAILRIRALPTTSIAFTAALCGGVVTGGVAALLWSALPLPAVRSWRGQSRPA